MKNNRSFQAEWCITVPVTTYRCTHFMIYNTDNIIYNTKRERNWENKRLFHAECYTSIVTIPTTT